MVIRTKHQVTDDTWFITFTCFNWLPLFEVTQLYDMVYKWLGLIEVKYQIKTLAFVIMPNHVHLLLHLTEYNINLNTVKGNAKRFMAYEFIQRLQRQNEHTLLNTLALACSVKEKAKGQLHKAFEPSFDAKPIYTLGFLNQKLDYIHHNPVSGKWNLADEFTAYPHSSAAYYYEGSIHPRVKITNYCDYWK